MPIACFSAVPLRSGVKLVTHRLTNGSATCVQSALPRLHTHAAGSRLRCSSPVGRANSCSAGILLIMSWHGLLVSAPSQEETPAERKARENVQKVQAKEQKKLHDANAKVANTLLSKISPSIVSARALLAKDNMHLVAGPMRVPVESSLASLVDLDALCQSALLNEGVASTPLPDARSIAGQLAELRKHSALVTQMLASIARVGN